VKNGPEEKNKELYGGTMIRVHIHESIFVLMVLYEK
jgi:hypothetical protein